jgi:UPF0755 protein
MATEGGSTDVVLPAGAGVAGVARALAHARVIRSPGLFVAAAVATGAGHGLKAGDYVIPSRTPLLRVLSMVRRGEVVRHLITVPEGLTSAEAAQILYQADFLTGEVHTPPEGALLPETYEVRRGESRQAVIRAMADARDRLLDRLWRERAPGLPYRDPEEAVILASVVEKETGKAAERARIAAVFINRLKHGMRLESDPTVIYGLDKGLPLGHGLRASELARRTAYNTYLVDGLPPTPIANPGRAALEAALRPAFTNDLYFVADGTGGHVFAETFEAHKRNVARWRAIERARAAAQGVG